MAEPEMILIEHPDVPGQVMLINAEDFNPAQHQLFTGDQMTPDPDVQTPVTVPAPVPEPLTPPLEPTAIAAVPAPVEPDTEPAKPAAHKPAAHKEPATHKPATTRKKAKPDADKSV